MPALITENEQILKAEQEIYGVDKTPNFFLADIYSADGSAPEEGESTATQVMDDRSIKVTITRDDNGSEWAYENDVSVYSAVARYNSIINSGFEVFAKNPDDETDVKAKEFIEKRIKGLTETISILNTNKLLFGWASFKKNYIGKDPKSLVPLYSGKCYPIRDLLTGELGANGIGKGLDPENNEKEVALIQDGSVPSYDQHGSVNYSQKYYYFTRDEIIYFTNNDRGKFKGMPAVRRVLRLVEIKKTIENTLELIVRRFGPQFKVIVGNQDINFTNTDIPTSYLRDSSGNPVARATARTNYKNDMFANINTKVQNWADANTLVQILEYGVDIQTINPPSTLPDYVRYLNTLNNYVRIGILGVSPEGRIDITSAQMREVSMKDLKDIAKKEQQQIISVLQDEYIDEILVANGFSKGQAYIKFKEIDKVDEMADAEIERRKSDTVANYIQRSGFTTLPKYLTEKWGIEVPEGIEPKPLKKTKRQKSPDEQNE